MQLHCIYMNVTKITTLWIRFAACRSSDQAGAWVAGSSAGEGWSWRGSSAKFGFYIHSTGSGGLSHLGRPTHLRSASGCRFCIPRSTSGCKFASWGRPQDASFHPEVDLRMQILYLRSTSGCNFCIWGRPQDILRLLAKGSIFKVKKCFVCHQSYQKWKPSMKLCKVFSSYI